MSNCQSDPSIFLFGSTSILGWNMMRMDTARHITPFCNPYTKNETCASWRRLRIESNEELQRLFTREQPDVLIHCGGICDVEKCQQNPEWAWEINVKSVERLLRVLPKKTRLVYCSSDHVFSDSIDAYLESDDPQPISTYGQTRAEAERQILAAREDALVIRSALAIGPSIDGRTGHLDWLAYRSKKRLPITIVEDEHRSAVWVEDLAERVLRLAYSTIGDIRHVPATQVVSRPSLAQFLNQHCQLGATFTMVNRKDRKVPHPGRIELGTKYRDTFAQPLPSPLRRITNRLQVLTTTSHI